VLFEMRYADAIADGSVDTTFRRWKRSQVVAGHTYRTAAGRLVVDAVDVVTGADITDADAVRAGYPSAAALLADQRGAADLPLYRVRFHAAPDADPRAELAAAGDLTEADVAEIDRRLERFDRAAPDGPWTATTLQIIAERPEVRAPDLAAALGRETAPFKLDVRKLKNLGLTLSLRIGYRLSPRGEAYRRAKAELR
jgi:hypothetical protein